VAGMTPSPSSHHDVLTVAEAAIEACRSVRTIRRAYRTGKLPAFRDGNGRGVRIRFADLRQWMMAEPLSVATQAANVDRPVGQIRHRKRADDRSAPSENLNLLKAARQRRNGAPPRR
jgi:excisionase family DNA binding protein